MFASFNCPDCRDSAANTGTPNVRTAIWLALAALQVPAASDQVAELEARVSNYDAALKDVANEIGTLLAHPEAVNRSPELRREEAQSLRIRFPRLTVSETNTAGQFVEALRTERQRLLAEKGDALWEMLVANRAKSCAALDKLIRTASDMERSPDWALLTLEERTAVRTTVEEHRRLAWKDGDPCQPPKRPVIDAGMTVD